MRMAQSPGPPSRKYGARTASASYRHELYANPHQYPDYDRHAIIRHRNHNQINEMNNQVFILKSPLPQTIQQLTKETKAKGKTFHVQSPSYNADFSSNTFSDCNTPFVKDRLTTTGHSIQRSTVNQTSAERIAIVNIEEP